MQIPDFEAIIEHELTFFPTEEMKRVFLAVKTSPREVIQGWIYGKELHQCWIIAGDSQDQIVYCQTGFGPGFPWSCQSPANIVSAWTHSGAHTFMRHLPRLECGTEKSQSISC